MSMYGFSVKKENLANVYASTLVGAAISGQFGSGEGVVVWNVHVSHTGAAGSVFEIRENTAGGALVFSRNLGASAGFDVPFPKGLRCTGTAAFVVVTATATVTVTFGNLSWV